MDHVIASYHTTRYYIRLLISLANTSLDVLLLYRIHSYIASLLHTYTVDNTGCIASYIEL